jgi:hypothetical protein
VSDPLRFTYESTPGAWRCYYDPEGPQGFGKTKDEALFDLWLSCGEEESLMKAIVAALAPLPQDPSGVPVQTPSASDARTASAPTIQDDPMPQPFTYLYGQPCAACGVPVRVPMSRNEKAAAVIGDRIWHGQCFPANHNPSGDVSAEASASDPWHLPRVQGDLPNIRELSRGSPSHAVIRFVRDITNEELEEVGRAVVAWQRLAQSGGGVAENVAENAYHDATDKIEEAIRDGADLPRSLLDSLDILIAAYKRSREGGSVQGATSMTRSDRKVLRSAALQLIEEARISRESQTDDAGAWGDKARDAALAMNARIDTLEIALRHIARYEDEDCAISSDDMAKLARAALAAGTAQEQKP